VAPLRLRPMQRGRDPTGTGRQTPPGREEGQKKIQSTFECPVCGSTPLSYSVNYRVEDQRFTRGPAPVWIIPSDPEKTRGHRLDLFISCTFGGHRLLSQPHQSCPRRFPTGRGCARARRRAFGASCCPQPGRPLGSVSANPTLAD
jgi:hypothetical protein